MKFTETKRLILLALLFCCPVVLNAQTVKGVLTDEETGEAICAYIADLDRSLKQYLADPDGFAGKAGALESEYRKLLDRYVL